MKIKISLPDTLPAVSSMLSLIAFLAFSSTPALGCACCAETGARNIYTEDLDGFMRETLSRLTAVGKAHVYTSACGLDCVDGIRDPQTSYSLTLDSGTDHWRMIFGPRTSPVGELTFLLPQTALSFAVDTEIDTETYGSILYKELRLDVQIKGTGVFAESVTPEIPAQLILSGRGNLCVAETDFSRWRLDVRGEKASFTMFGQLEPAK